MTEPVVMKVWRDGIGRPTVHDHRYVTKLNTDVPGLIAEVESSDDLDDALVWPSMAQAIAAWQAVSSLLPVRPDGQPNRPGKAYNVEIIPLMTAQVDDAFSEINPNPN